MKIKQTVLAAAITAVLGVGAVGQASADVYAGSRLDIANLNIFFANANGTPAAQQQPVTSFNFTLTNSAGLDGGDFKQAKCSGTNPGAPGTTNNCSAVPVNFSGPGSRDANPANAPLVTLARANNDMTLFGPDGVNNYANADSVIKTASVLLQGNTNTNQVAEANLVSKPGASSSALIQSLTGFTFNFTVAGTNNMVINFDADPDLRAAITALETATGNNAQADMNVSFTLNQTTDAAGGALGSANWNPQGTLANDCSASGGVVCVETADTQDLNINVGTSTNGTDVRSSFGAGDLGFGDQLTNFGVFISGLDAGTWSLTLNANTSTTLTRVPEPGMLALLGIGMAGMVAVARRRTRA